MKSSTGKVLIAAKNEIILTAGSGYIRIGNSQVEIGAPDHILLKTAVVQKQGAASMASQFNTWQTGKYEAQPEIRYYVNRKAVKGRTATIKRDTGDQKIQTDHEGKVDQQHSDFSEGYSVIVHKK